MGIYRFDVNFPIDWSNRWDRDGAFAEVWSVFLSVHQQVCSAAHVDERIPLTHTIKYSITHFYLYIRLTPKCCSNQRSIRKTALFTSLNLPDNTWPLACCCLPLLPDLVSKQALPCIKRKLGYKWWSRGVLLWSQVLLRCLSESTHIVITCIYRSIELADDSGLWSCSIASAEERKGCISKAFVMKRLKVLVRNWPWNCCIRQIPAKIRHCVRTSRRTIYQLHHQ